MRRFQARERKSCARGRRRRICAARCHHTVIVPFSDASTDTCGTERTAQHTLARLCNKSSFYNFPCSSTALSLSRFYGRVFWKISSDFCRQTGAVSFEPKIEQLVSNVFVSLVSLEYKTSIEILFVLQGNSPPENINSHATPPALFDNLCTHHWATPAHRCPVMSSV